jgi:hypothetical protein
LAAQEGKWALTDTFRPKPDGDPQVSTGLVANRTMVGSFLEETLHSAGETKPLRIDYLGYDAIAGKWRYISIEARVPVAPMPAASFTRDAPEHITLRFDPFAAPAIAPGWAGRMLRMEEVITRDGPDHETRTNISSWPMGRAYDGSRTGMIIGASVEAGEPPVSRGSIPRRGSRQKLGVLGEPAGHEFGEQPHALGLARLPLREEPNRPI